MRLEEQNQLAKSLSDLSEITPEIKRKVQELADMLYSEGQLDKQINAANLFYNP